ncbi:hypothetical protein J3D48_004941 [Pseudomonas fluorescens]|jgi:hypothetical protein|uniref:hypothetical protein n=1 Tax=Pseudomonas fluorescens TaxID=294 RepID=UPI0020A1A5A5|nr:hypothetical protein [Pseudomonas fluorescens]MCP1488628.1 hypothetical protein [Pseudomonas fluorescens]
MANKKGTELVADLGTIDEAAGIFGICYSILTWSGVGKGFSPFSLGSWTKTLGKLAEDGHATTFLIDGENITLTGISETGWEFSTGTLASQDWARATGSATTYVYYIGVNKQFIKKYRKLQAKLKKTKTAYDVLWPNLANATTQYQNCVSHSHYLVSELGLAHWANTIKGWWMPSASNWVDWFKSFAPTQRDGFSWKYKKFDSTNTHIP